MEIDVLVLAAGLSRRFCENKLIYKFDGKALLCHCLDLCKKLLGDGAVSGVTIVTSNDDFLKNILAGFPEFDVCINDHPEIGISSSIKSGLSKILQSHPDSGAVLILLGDMPHLTESLILKLIDNIQHKDVKISVCAIEENGISQFRNPAIFKSCLYDKFRELGGDVGAMPIIRRQYNDDPDSVSTVPATKTELHDIDTKTDLFL